MGAEGDGFKIAMAGLDGGRLNIGACSLGGGASGARQGDRLHARAQGVRAAHRSISRRCSFVVADIATSLEAARAMLWRAASALDAKSPDATRLCAMAKRVATDAGIQRRQ